MTRGEPIGIARKHHPWGRFQPGAWKLVRVTTETFEDNAALISTTETKTTLQAVDDSSVTLLIEVTVEVAGKRFRTQPHLIKQNFYGELTDHEMTVADLGLAEVTIQNVSIGCRLIQLSVPNTTSRMVTKIYYSETVEPFILRRETTKSDVQTGATLSETVVDVTAIDVPCDVLGTPHRCASVKWVQQHDSGRSTTLALTADDIPGGVVCHTLKEEDATGRIIRRSELQLVDYGLEPDEQRRGLFRRKRSSRGRKAYRYRAY